MADRPAEILVYQDETWCYRPTEDAKTAERSLRVDQATARRWRKAQKDFDRMAEEIEEAIEVADREEALARKAAKKGKRS